MRISPNFILREVAGEFIVIPVGEAARNLSGLIALNGSAKFLFDLLQADRTEKELLNAMLNAYDIDEPTAAADISEFLEMLREQRMLIEPSM